LTTEPTLFEDTGEREAPLAHRMRPETLDDFLGQEHLLGPGKPLREAIERGSVGSLVFWGPPGCGKTTLARLLANYTDKAFVPFSAVTEGVPRVRQIIQEAQRQRQAEARGTLLFCDEIHRFNKAQQDAFLPWVEEGVLTLIGATTENPSFELNSALLSRVRVFVLEPLEPRHIEAIVTKALTTLAASSKARGQTGAAANLRPALAEDALALLARHADGDARRALNAVEAVWDHVSAHEALLAEPITAALVQTVLERRVARYDKAGEEHFNLVSALHKAVRGSDVEGALYWLARMLDGGEDPLYVARRIVRMAAEDVGLADPRALSLALAAKDTYHFLGSPEGELALAEAVIYLATAPKSNRVYEAWSRARAAAREHPAELVPHHIRNAPTRLMKDLGYGKGYRYDHAEGGYAAGQEYLPETLRGAQWYVPTGQGFEKTIAERLRWWSDHKKKAQESKAR
jgi:putative ATPase